MEQRWGSPIFADGAIGTDAGFGIGRWEAGTCDDDGYRTQPEQPSLAAFST
jgi:hypothetical protein